MMLGRIRGDIDVNAIIDRCYEAGANEGCVSTVAEFTRDFAEAKFWLSAAGLMDLVFFIFVSFGLIFCLWPIAKQLAAKVSGLWKGRAA